MGPAAQMVLTVPYPASSRLAAVAVAVAVGEVRIGRVELGRGRTMRIEAGELPAAVVADKGAAEGHGSSLVAGQYKSSPLPRGC